MSVLTHQAIVITVSEGILSTLVQTPAQQILHATAPAHALSALRVTHSLQDNVLPVHLVQAVWPVVQLVQQLASNAQQDHTLMHQTSVRLAKPTVWHAILLPSAPLLLQDILSSWQLTDPIVECWPSATACVPPALMKHSTVFPALRDTLFRDQPAFRIFTWLSTWFSDQHRPTLFSTMELQSTSNFPTPSRQSIEFAITS